MRWSNSEGLSPAGSARWWVGFGSLALAFSAVLCCLGLTSCSSTKARRAQADADLLRATGFWQPHNLYLLSSPHPRLCVEVDAVEGCSPSDETLAKLREFLTACCNKPGGIEIARSDIIPLDQALGVLPSALARKYLNGPPEQAAGPAPAFLYVLFYSDSLSDRPTVAETGHLGARAARHLRLENRNPHVDMLPYPAMIYMNVHWWGIQSMRDAALQHEAGHILGLAFRPDNASGGHCRSGTCLMAPGLRISHWVLGRDHSRDERLCERCLGQLASSRTQAPPSNLRFIGPVLVRSEPDYEVLNLPHRARVILGDASEQDCREFAAAVRGETPSPVDHESERRVDASGKDELLRDPTKLRELITRVAADPDVFVRRLAPGLWTACAGQYHAQGQFTNAVAACRQSIEADPADARSYNLLAWIKATCPDQSIRDGQEAVSAATKACQLTQWKEKELD